MTALTPEQRAEIAEIARQAAREEIAAEKKRSDDAGAAFLADLAARRAAMDEGTLA